MLLRDAMQTRMRRAVGLALIVILCLSTWICLIAGCITLMGPALGFGEAFLVMAAFLAATAFVAVLISRLSAKSFPERLRIETREARLIAAAGSAVLSVLNNKRRLRLALIATSAIAAGLVLLLSGGDVKDDD